MHNPHNNTKKPRSLVRRAASFFLLVGTFILLLFPPATAHANPIADAFQWVMFKVPGFFLYVISVIISFFVGLLFSVGGYLVSLAVKLNLGVMTDRALQTGFPVTLQVVNLGFVLVIIVIAFATILRYEQYGMKKMLGKLIIAALLVNFSLTIAGVLLDFANILTTFFIDRATNNNVLAFADELSGAFGIQRLLKANPVDADVFTSSITSFKGLVLAIASLGFTILFMLLGTITMIGIAVMLLIRYVTILILLILMPFAWLGYAMPGLGGWWSKWWNAFLKNALFMPVTIFFLWLAVSVVRGLSVTNSILQGQLNWDVDLITGSLQEFGTMFAVLGLMVGGLIAGQKLGIAGARGTMGVMKAMKTGFIGKPGMFTKKVGDWSKAAAEKAGRTPGVRQLLRPISAPAREAYKEQKEGETKERAEGIKERLEGGTMNIDQLQQTASIRQGIGRGGAFTRT